jgi:predicted molibdopterin-dependent oxidoreductase YjgC
MNSTHENVTLTVDNQPIEAQRGLTILQAAQRNNIYIPTLCAHKDLTPFGGCRMCIVEVEGMRGLPTACTTPVEEGMVIRTHTAQVHAVRQEILQLILSEHTSSCLICDEQEECKRYSTTIRKAGVTTGCRYCPNDQQCELQEVVERLGLKEINYPIYYRHLPVEKDDPFYDRDYNLCILCGRCVRMCQDVRTAGTLAFTQRGRHTVIGPAFHRTHYDAGCEFCGACVSVCPTGALAEKASKWEGKPEREEITTCALCGVGCQIRLQLKNDCVIGSLPAEDPLIANGQLCVKGRFCLPELLNGHQRLRKPYQSRNRTQALIAWENAVDLAAEKLSSCPPDEFGMLVSPNCTNEDLYVAQKFVRVAMRSHRIDTSARVFYGAGFRAYLDLMKTCIPLADVHMASLILCVGLDARFGRSVVGVELRKATRAGARVVTIHPRQHSISTISEKWIQPAPGTEVRVLRSLVSLTRKHNEKASQRGATRDSADDELRGVAGILREAAAPVVLVGSEFLHHTESAEILNAIRQLASNIGAGIVPLPAQNNLIGSVLMGAYPELLPGGHAATDSSRLDVLRQKWGAAVAEFRPSWNAGRLSSEAKLKVLYLIGEVPSGLRSLSEFSIFQNMYPPDPFHAADLVLPAAAFSEIDGTFINGEGRIQKVRKAVSPPGEALPDWQIICRIARKMGIDGFDFNSVAEVQQEISSFLPEFGESGGGSRRFCPLRFEGEFSAAQGQPRSARRKDRKFPLVLSAVAAEDTYRGFPLSTWVEGARKLFPEGILDISPKDAAQAGISSGDEVILSSDNFESVWPARVLSDQPEGMLHIVLRQGEVPNPNPHPVSLRKRDV